MPWYYGWNVIAVAMFMIAMIFGAITYSFSFWVDPWMVEFDASRGEIMTAILAAQLIGGFTAPAVGRALDKYAIRWVLATGALIASAGYLLISAATALWQIIAVYGVFLGAAYVMCGFLPGQALAVRWFRRNRGLAIGLVSIGTSIGAFMMPPIVTYCINAFGWRSAHLLIAGGFAFLLVPLILLVVANGPEARNIEPEPEAEPAGNTAPEPPIPDDETWTTPAILGSPSFILMAIAFALPSMAVSAVLLNYAPLMKDIGVEASYAALIMSALAIMMIVGKFTFGILSDRIDQKVLFSIAMAFIALSCVLLTASPDAWRIGLATVSLAIGGGGLLPLIGAMIAKRFGAAAFGRVMGLMTFVLAMASASAPGAGIIRDATGSYDLALHAAAFGAMLSVAMIAFLTRVDLPQPRSQEV